MEEAVQNLKYISNALRERAAHAATELEVASTALDSAAALLRLAVSALAEVKCSDEHSELQNTAIDDICIIIGAISELAPKLGDRTNFHELVVLKGSEHAHMVAYLDASHQLNVAFASLVRLMQFDVEKKMTPNIEEGFLVTSAGTVYGRTSFAPARMDGKE
ncbi:hypothetical protein ACF3M1_10235 [Luteimonas sp. WGS1318]|uniref:hypothetical protein n=1 Tax=Luteimonas sp. WGS1318 TaxID=3366815 RepID=UPI00372D7E6D